MPGDGFTQTAFTAHLAEHKLMGSHCRTCGSRYLPPRALCAACYGDDMEWVALDGKGRLKAFTIIHIAPTAMIQAGYGRENPYCSGIVELEGGLSISAQIVGVEAGKPESISIGMPLEVTFLPREEADQTRTYLAFQPAGQA